ncbi:MAG TPA: cation:proton antiporter subunit C [Pirellulales bacterium]|nr:cation:proton antiporter subunit C [Pirellulales bacterium]
MTHLAYGVAAWLLFVGLYGIVSSRNLIHMVICLTVVQRSTYVLLIAVGYRSGAHAPVLADLPHDAFVVDPVVQALALTDIVVGATTTALLLAMAVRVHKLQGTLDPSKLRPLHNRKRKPR